MPSPRFHERESNVVKVKETWLHASCEGMKKCCHIKSIRRHDLFWKETSYWIKDATTEWIVFCLAHSKVNIKKNGTCIENHIVAPCDSRDWKLQANDCHVIPSNYEYLSKYSIVCIVNTKDSSVKIRALFIQRADCTFAESGETTKQRKKTKMKKMIFLKNALNFNERTCCSEQKYLLHGQKWKKMQMPQRSAFTCEERK